MKQIVYIPVIINKQKIIYNCCVFISKIDAIKSILKNLIDIHFINIDIDGSTFEKIDYLLNLNSTNLLYFTIADSTIAELQIILDEICYKYGNKKYKNKDDDEWLVRIDEYLI